jgi:hypothetical protein
MAHRFLSVASIALKEMLFKKSFSRAGSLDKS